ncbi:MAG: hypothetical protein HOM68_20005 [Gemmatimonadetes bacterium]|nr:hypothetical protein [Gemmatimonadota bacterium]MBT5142375.1 hypothetical protein [Gemmatimonadota bacterium]MBT5962620.1 hypothetical protein [Gemmatimonadota bacterium]MBT7457141.1 hypothetical protein [Gemmatimonadota bacterium]
MIRPRVFWILLLATSVRAATPQIFPTSCDRAPRIDGQLDDECWTTAAHVEDFTVAGQGTAPDKAMEAFVAYDSSSLHFAFRCQEPDPQQMQLRHLADHPDIWQDDVVEIFLRTGGDRMAIDQLLVNAAGARWGLRRRPGGFQPWPPTWPAAAKIDVDHWTVELSVPWDQIGVDSPLPGRLIEVKFGREDYTANPVRLSVWPPGSQYAGIDGYGRIYLDPPHLLHATKWTSADGADIRSAGLRLTAGTTVAGEVRLRPHTPHSLHIAAEGVGVATVEVGDMVRTLQLDHATDSVTVDFVTSGQGETPLRLSASEGSLDVDLQLLEVPRLLTAGAAIPLPSGQPLAIEHVPVADARAVRGFIGTPFDGSMATRSWNGQVWEYPQAGAGAGVGYAYGGNDGLHVRFADAEGFDALQIRGGIRADLFAPGVSYQGPDQQQPLYHFPGRTLRSRALFEKRVTTQDVSFFNVTDGVIADAAFFRLKEIEQPASSTQWPLGGGFTTTDARTGIGALGITFETDDAPRQLTLIVDDPLDPRLQLMTVDVEVMGSGSAFVLLDIIDQVVPAGTWISCRAQTQDGQAWTEGTAQLFSISPALANIEASAHRQFLVKTFFACASEPRPWTGLPRAGSLEDWFDRHPMGDQLRQLFTAVDHARWIDPADETMRQYEQWLWRNRRTPDTIEPALLDTTPSAPAWARWARTAWLTARAVPDWWLQHRLVETGEFGGAVGDDTDLYQNFVDFTFFEDSGVGARLRDAAARLAELAERTTLTDGINQRTMDPLHAYEEGLNQEALMSAWNYGDPVLLERNMLAARSVADLTVVTDLGHRHFRSQLLGSDARNSSATDMDGQAHPSMWHPALEVLWYNQNPLIERWLREWADGWLAHFEPGRYAHAVDVASEQIQGVNTRPLYGGYGGQGSAFAFLAQITGDLEYASPFFDTYAAGSTATSPADLVLDFYHRFGAQAFGNSLAQLPLRGNAAAVVHGDMDALVEILRSDIAELQGFNVMYTSSEPFTDRVFLNAIRHAAISYTGGFATRNKFNRSHAVSWGGFGTDYAAFVAKAGRDEFRARLFNFSADRIHGHARFWQLQHGTYQIRSGPDRDDDGQIDTQANTREQVLRRGEPIDIDLPAGGSVVEIEKVRALPPLYLAPDLALSPLDIRIEGNTISGWVHNIGRGPAGARLSLIAADGATRFIELGVIDAPDDLLPRRLAFRFESLSLPEGQGLLRVTSTPQIEELTRVNNVVDLADVRTAMRRSAEIEAAIRAEATQAEATQAEATQARPE